MNIGDWFSLGASCASMLGFIVLLARMSRTRRDDDAKRGAREEADRQAHARIETIETRVSALEKESHAVEVTLTEIKVILERVVIDVAALGNKLDDMRSK